MMTYFSFLKLRFHQRLLVILILTGVFVTGISTKIQAAATDTTIKTNQATEIGESVEVPIMLSENRMIVPLKIEGAGEQFFILDTAAGGSVISPRLRKQLNIDPASVHRDTVKGASGKRLMEKVILPELQFGDQSFSEISAVVFPTNAFREYEGKRVEGILGVNVLKHFDLSFDLNNRVLQLYQNRRLNQNADRISIPFKSNVQPGFVEFEIHINGEPVQAILDSGARRNILNWKAANALGITQKHPDVEKRQKNSKGIDGVGGVGTYDYTFDQVQLGTTNLRNTATKIVDYPIFDMLGIGDGPAMLVGLEIFKHCQVEINYSTNQLVFIQ